jgi:hypothetical protein
MPSTFRANTFYALFSVEAVSVLIECSLCLEINFNLQNCFDFKSTTGCNMKLLFRSLSEYLVAYQGSPLSSRILLFACFSGQAALSSW